ncbi:MAG: hypothetical protein R3E79_60330 [Caldilineaceae bacterium]
MLTVPAGTQNGRTFRLRGWACPSSNSYDQRGDLLAEVTVKLPSDLTTEEKSFSKAAGNAEWAKLGDWVIGNYPITQSPFRDWL